MRYFSGVAKPFTDFTKQDVPWNWGDEEAEVFQKLRSGLGEGSILAMYNLKLQLHTNVSQLGMESMLIE